MLHEIMALGAVRVKVAAIFLRQALLLSATGVAIGAAASVLADRASESIVGGAPSPLMLSGVSMALLLTSILASWIPARNAARVDPQKALRQD